jgi:protein involved in polysaccharide export with SLBB domain
MKRLVYAGVIASMVFFVSTIIAFSQTDREIPSKKDSQAQAVVDKERYVIGPEDVLYIHVWREDAFSRTVPVRMDGNISLPLIH